MKIILPLSTAHSITFILFLLATIIIRRYLTSVGPVNYIALIEVANSIVCVYTFVIPLVYYYLKKKMFKKTVTQIVSQKNERNEYFKTLETLFDKKLEETKKESPRVKTKVVKKVTIHA
uniref:Uncharacterized protein n=1 Tax=Acrobeloides nanus TaxID=290746 RepID=A0A914CH31_9BILA